MTEPYRDDYLASCERLAALRASRRDLDEQIESLEQSLTQGPDMDWLDGQSKPIACTESWSQMDGDKRVRRCNRCHKNVYHLHGLPRVAALDLIREQGDAIDVELRRRDDGTVVTAGCPPSKKRVVGWVLLGIAGAGCGLVAVSVADDISTMGKFRTAKITSAKVGAAVISQVVEVRQSDQAEPTCPTVRDLVDAKKLAASKTDDPWGKPYRIECNGEDIHVYSNGRDGLPNTADDIADDAKPADIERIADLPK